MTAMKVLSILVENKPGMLYRIAHMIRLMRINIEGLTCGVENGGDTSRITMSVQGEDATIDFIAVQLRKVIGVYDAQTYSEEEVTLRELALVKLKLEGKSRLADSRLSGARILGASDRCVTVEVVGAPRDIDRFVHRFKKSCVIELARTGITAVPRK